MTPRNVSRLWLKRYARPRRPDGRFDDGVFLWTRTDGGSRWLHYPTVGPDDLADMRWLSSEAVRVMTHLVVIVVAALLIFWFA